VTVGDLTSLPKKVSDAGIFMESFDAAAIANAIIYAFMAARW